MTRSSISCEIKWVCYFSTPWCLSRKKTYQCSISLPANINTYKWQISSVHLLCSPASSVLLGSCSHEQLHHLLSVYVFLTLCKNSPQYWPATRCAVPPPQRWNLHIFSSNLPWPASAWCWSTSAWGGCCHCRILGCAGGHSPLEKKWRGLKIKKGWKSRMWWVLQAESLLGFSSLRWDLER